MEERSYYVTMGANLGDSISAKVLDSHLNELSSLLDYHCDKTYCSNLNEMALTLSVGGEIWTVDFEGPKNMRLNKKQKHITIEIGMPPKKWREKSDYEIREFIMFNFSEALDMMIKRIKKEKWEIDSDQLTKDFQIVKKQFLSI
jgi:hypothetical protein